MFVPPAATCDPATGLCTPVALDSPAPEVDFSDEVEIIYVGDPMCSWCWGISPHLNRLEKAAVANGISYRIVVGGLRPTASDPWDDNFKNFLRHHWEEVHERSGQPFNYDLFEKEAFDYGTESACRAVVAARQLNPALESRFFELVQHYFYVGNQAPSELSFYAPICERLGLDFSAFTQAFNSEEVIQQTLDEFRLNRSWGVTGYPTVIFRQGRQLTAIARGYAEFDRMWAAVVALRQ